MPDTEPQPQPPPVHAGPPAPEQARPGKGKQQADRPAGSWRHPGWSWTAGRDWVVTSGFAVATLLIGAALGGIPVVAAGSWHDPQTRNQAWAFLALGAAGVAVLTGSEVVHRGRNRMLRRNGTAYIVQEQAREWTLDESRDFLAAARRQFARTIRVPGPGELGGAWDWPLGDGARDWDAKVTELARSFQALHTDDDPQTPNGIFLWAWWAVAVAYGARVTAADRGLTLDIWQRPSRGRAGHLGPAPWSQRPHRFGQGSPAPGLAEILPDSAPQERIWPAQVTISQRVPGTAARPAGEPGLSVLLVRLGRQRWGPMPAVLGDPVRPDPEKPVSLSLEDAADLGPGGRFRSEIHELRCLPPGGGTGFAWPAFPSLVAGVSGWIRRKAADLDGRVLVLGAVMPAEAALGLGIDSAQVSKPGWPAHLWPVVYQPSTGALVIARLELGAAALANAAGGR